MTSLHSDADHRIFQHDLRSEKSLKLFNFQNGETPLHKACRKCHYPAVKELLAHAKKQNKDNESKIEAYVRHANHDGEQVKNEA